MMKRANVGIKGNVQMAGFRTFIKNIADSLNVNGFAENLEDGSVRVVCEGEEDGINDGDYKGEFTSFVRRGDDVPQRATLDDILSVLKSFDSKAERLVSISSNMDATLKSVKEDTKMIPGIKENTEKMLEKQDMVLQKQDNTIAEIRNVSEKIAHGKEDIVTEIKSLREDLRMFI